MSANTIKFVINNKITITKCIQQEKERIIRKLSAIEVPQLFNQNQFDAIDECFLYAL